MADTDLEWTGERFLPEIGGTIALEHIHRYLMARALAKDKDVLDIACGEGYGSAMLAEIARHVSGVDISDEAVVHATEKYRKENLQFLVGSCAAIPLPDDSIDLVVSFETIEHHNQHQEMMQEIKRVLRPDGVLIISSPDKYEFSDIGQQGTHYHVKELYRHEFEELIKSFFSCSVFLGQRVLYGSAILSEELNTKSITYLQDEGSFSGTSGLPCPLYILAIASDVDTPKISVGILEQPVHESDAVRQIYIECVQLHHKIGERDATIEELHHKIGERDATIEELHHNIAEYEVKIELMQKNTDTVDVTIGSLQKEKKENEGNAAELSRQLDQILQSWSWRITKPLRFVRRIAVSQPYIAVRRMTSNGVRALWYSLPLSLSTRQKLKVFVATNLPWIFRWVKACRTWSSFNGPEHVVSLINRTAQTQQANKNEYVPFLNGKPLREKPVKIICFYLPQFHPIPENNTWWGEGFTEWVNVQPAQPQFEGHYQPRVPGELGFYNLLDPVVQHRQVELAKLYGIEGFCFYFYWFGGKRLLETPVENYLNDSSLNLPFCLCWANENWSRRWDGLDNEILIAQEHSPGDDLAFIQYVARYMRDPRYICIGGKPLLLVYRPGLFPSAKDTSKRWRKWCSDNGIGEIYLAYTQSFDKVDPAKYGFDAAIEFPPNNSVPPNITESVNPLDEEVGFNVYDWRIFLERSEKYQQPGYTLFRGVCPSWDNTARRKNNSTIFLNSSPALYRKWLENAIRDTVQHHSSPDERLVFVNAWNEWAEGAYLEPDAHYGYAYLQATRNALGGDEIDNRENHKRIVLVAHDAYPHGAQLLALNLAKTLNQGMGFNVDLVCLGDGPLKTEYAKWATLHDLTGLDARGPEAVTLARKLYEAGSRAALVNTTVSGYFLETLADNGFECVALIHELRSVLDQLGLHRQAKAIAEHATKIVFPAEEVATSFKEVAPTDGAKIVIRPQGLYKRRNKSSDFAADRKNLRQKLGLPDDSQIVLGVGFADYRKGIDLFVEAGLEMAQRIPLARWVWIGHWEESMQREVDKRLADFRSMKDRFIFPGLQSDTDLFFGGADVFALTSREDPFPSVVLEALDAEVPVVGFEGAGGFIGLLSEDCGQLVAKEDAAAFAVAVGNLLEAPYEREALGRRGAELINERFSFRHYIYDLLDFMNQGLARVSVVVPNFNYAHYLPDRLTSICGQNYPLFEIIFLDDCSTDKSVSVARDILEAQPIDYKIIVNEENSGSVFSQWKKGVDVAKGDHVWIAEADDSCSNSFLSEVMHGFQSPGVVLSYCESKQMDDDGKILAHNYLAYVDDIDARRWSYPFVRSGHEEATEALCIKNTIPNVSGVVFEKSRLKSVLDEHIDLIRTYRVAGDWLVYVLMLREGKIAFSPASLNMHRRHSHGVTIGSFNKYQLDEIQRMQAFVAKEFEVPQDKVVIARGYIEQLSRQFGLVPHKPLIREINE